MKHLKILAIGLAASAMSASAALAQWQCAAELSAGGEPKEVSAKYQNVLAIQLQGVEGKVDIQGIVVRNGGQKKELLVGRSLGPDETFEIALGKQAVTGFRVTDGGTGRYRINVIVDDIHRHHHPDLHHPPLDPHSADRDAPPAQQPTQLDRTPAAPAKPASRPTQTKPHQTKPPKSAPKAAPKAPARSAPARGPR